MHRLRALHVMAKVDRPLNLITMDTERNQYNRQAGKPTEARLVRPRTVIYVVILAILGIGVLTGLSMRDNLDLNVLPDRNPLFVKLADGSIRNGYTVKVLNQVRDTKTYQLTIDGLEGATVSILGLENSDSRSAKLDAKPDQISTYRLFITAPPATIAEPVRSLSVVLTDQAGDEAFTFETVFRGPNS